MAKHITVTEAVAQLTAAIKSEIINRMIGAGEMLEQTGLVSARKPTQPRAKKKGKRVSVSEDDFMAFAKGEPDKTVNATTVSKKFGNSYAGANNLLKAHKAKFTVKKVGTKVLYTLK